MVFVWTLSLAAFPLPVSAQEPVDVPKAYAPAELDGPSEKTPVEEWMYLTSAQRAERVSLAIGLIEKNGAIVMKNTYDYLKKVDQYLGKGYQEKDRNLDTAILHVIYENEPQTRAAIQKMFQEHADE